MAARISNTLIKLDVVQEDVRYVAADVLLLKFARRLHGADEAVVCQLIQAGVCSVGSVAPEPGKAHWVAGGTAIQAKQILFIGTLRLGLFRYREIREFAKQAIEFIAQSKRPIKTLATTVHGANYGLDIEESLKAMVLGFQQGLTAHPLFSLERITFVEQDEMRSEMIQRALGDIELVLPAPPPASTTPYKSSASDELVEVSTPKPQVAEAQVAYSAAHKGANGHAIPLPPIELKQRSVFVAMPFSEEFDDVYQFGIYATVRRCGYACEKVDQAMFTGSIVDRITEGIRAADFLIADLTDERPNVYLEVGFAWALKKPVIILAREGQRLHFDVSHHRCLFYRTIGKLSEPSRRRLRKCSGKGTDLKEPQHVVGKKKAVLLWKITCQSICCGCAW